MFRDKNDFNRLQLEHLLPSAKLLAPAVGLSAALPNYQAHNEQQPAI